MGIGSCGSYHSHKHLICMQRPSVVSNRMARTYHHHPLPYSINAADNDDDEYIDIEVNSFSPESRSFEFQMSPVFTALPAADVLFYKGKLLPLQGDHNSPVEEDDFIVMDFESSTGLSTFINQKIPGKFWSGKLRLIKKCLISKKLKASRAYLLSLFRKSAKAVAEYNHPSGKCFHLKAEHKKTPFVGIRRWRHPIIERVIKKIDKDRIEDNNHHRRSLSFSSAAEYKKCLAPSSLSGASSSSFSSASSSISFSSTDFYELNFHHRSCSHFEGPIEAAITHCKKSQQQEKTFIQAGHFALSAPKIATS